MSRILVVDDEPQILRALGINLRARGYEVDLAPTGEDGLRLAASQHPDVVVLDIGLPGISGIDAARRVRAAGRIYAGELHTPGELHAPCWLAQPAAGLRRRYTFSRQLGFWPSGDETSSSISQ